MAEVFISYTTKDIKKAEYILMELEKNGISCWIAPRDIKPGSFYTKEIVEAITSASIFLLLLSKESQNSKYVIRELDTAFDKSRRIIPFLLDNEKITDPFILLIKGTQQIIAYNDFSEAVELLTKEMQTHLSDRKKSVIQKTITCPKCGSHTIIRKSNPINKFHTTIFMEREFRIHIRDTDIVILSIGSSIAGICSILEFIVSIALGIYAGLFIFQNNNDIWYGIKIVSTIFLTLFLFFLVNWLLISKSSPLIKKFARMTYHKCDTCNTKFKKN